MRICEYGIVRPYGEATGLRHQAHHSALYAAAQAQNTQGRGLIVYLVSEGPFGGLASSTATLKVSSGSAPKETAAAFMFKA